MTHMGYVGRNTSLVLLGKNGTGPATSKEGCNGRNRDAVANPLWPLQHRESVICCPSDITGGGPSGSSERIENLVRSCGRRT